MSDERLSRLKSKLNERSKAIVEIDRMEKRLLTIFKHMKHMHVEFIKYDDLVMRLKGKL